jgi:hypothetical protein
MTSFGNRPVTARDLLLLLFTAVVGSREKICRRRKNIFARRRPVVTVRVSESLLHFHRRPSVNPPGVASFFQTLSSAKN